MAILTINTASRHETLREMTVNGKPVKFKKTRDKIFSAQVDLKELPIAEIIIYRGNRYAGACWWLFEIFYFLLSIFGIFDTRLDKRFITIDSRFVVDVVTDTTAEFSVNEYVDGGEFVKLNTTANYRTVSNVNYKDESAVAKHKTAKKMKLLIFFGILLTVAAFILLKIFKVI